MTTRLELAPAETCVWMSAGVLSYKLCDRQFDCEHCPLDAALRGVPLDLGDGPPPGPDLRRRPVVSFPADRLYSKGHDWVQPQSDRPGHVRLGLDAFAVSLLAQPCRVRWMESSRSLQRDDPLCVIEFTDGEVELISPLGARLDRQNRMLDEEPGIVVAAPYGDGWIVDLAGVQSSELTCLLSAETAWERARLDLRRLRRRIALRLLADEENGPSPPERDEQRTDGWGILDGAAYFDLVRDLVH